MTAVWRPTQERTTASNTAAFMRAHQIESFDELRPEVGIRPGMVLGGGRRVPRSPLRPTVEGHPGHLERASMGYLVRGRWLQPEGVCRQVGG